MSLLVCPTEAEGPSKTAKSDYCKYNDKEEVVVYTPGRTAASSMNNRSSSKKPLPSHFLKQVILPVPAKIRYGKNWAYRTD